MAEETEDRLHRYNKNNIKKRVLNKKVCKTAGFLLFMVSTLKLHQTGGNFN